MIRSFMLLLILPIGVVAAQQSPIRLTIVSTQAQFRVTSLPGDSTQRPLVGMGRWEMLADTASSGSAAAFPTVEIVALDSLRTVHVEATRDGRVIAGGDGGYVLVRRDANTIAIEARSSAPASVVR